MDLPPHPERNDDQQSAAINWIAVAVITIVVALVAFLVILHLTGVVGPAAE
jgi:hypothetical protein